MPPFLKLSACAGHTQLDQEKPASGAVTSPSMNSTDPHCCSNVRLQEDLAIRANEPQGPNELIASSTERQGPTGLAIPISVPSGASIQAIEADELSDGYALPRMPLKSFVLTEFPPGIRLSFENVVTVDQIRKMFHVHDQANIANIDEPRRGQGVVKVQFASLEAAQAALNHRMEGMVRQDTRENVVHEKFNAITQAVEDRMKEVDRLIQRMNQSAAACAAVIDNLTGSAAPKPLLTISCDTESITTHDQALGIDSQKQLEQEYARGKRNEYSRLSKRHRVEMQKLVEQHEQEKQRLIRDYERKRRRSPSPDSRLNAEIPMSPGSNNTNVPRKMRKLHIDASGDADQLLSLSAERSPPNTVILPSTPKRRMRFDTPSPNAPSNLIAATPAWSFSSPSSALTPLTPLMPMTPTTPATPDAVFGSSACGVNEAIANAVTVEDPGILATPIHRYSDNGVSGLSLRRKAGRSPMQPVRTGATMPQANIAVLNEDPDASSEFEHEVVDLTQEDDNDELMSEGDTIEVPRPKTDNLNARPRRQSAEKARTFIGGIISQYGRYKGK